VGSVTDRVPNENSGKGGREYTVPQKSGTSVQMNRCKRRKLHRSRRDTVTTWVINEPVKAEADERKRATNRATGHILRGPEAKGGNDSEVSRR